MALVKCPPCRRSCTRNAWISSSPAVGTLHGSLTLLRAVGYGWAATCEHFFGAQPIGVHAVEVDAGHPDVTIC